MITAGVKDADYDMALNQYQDNGKTVGCLGGVVTHRPGHQGPRFASAARRSSHTRIGYNNWLPNITARYRVRRQLVGVRQFAEGSIIPPSGVFDVPDGQVLTPPKPTLAKTYQIGSVLKFNRWTLDADAYYVHFQNGYDSYLDPVSGESSSSPPAPPIPRAWKRRATSSSMAGLQPVPQRIDGLGEISDAARIIPTAACGSPTRRRTSSRGVCSGSHKNWDVGLIDKRVGTMYNDNGTLNYMINGVSDPVSGGPGHHHQSVQRLEPLFQLHDQRLVLAARKQIPPCRQQLVRQPQPCRHHAVYRCHGGRAVRANPGDQLNLLPGRSVMVSLTLGYAPRR